MAGYSKTPLAQKLGIKEGHRVALLSAPPGMDRTIGKLPALAKMVTKIGANAELDVILRFVTTRRGLSESFAALAGHLHPAGGLWVCWPKKASGVATDVSEDVVRAIALRAGLVDNKVCAIDEVWSGLRCVIRLENRPAPTARSGPRRLPKKPRPPRG